MPKQTIQKFRVGKAIEIKLNYINKLLINFEDGNSSLCLKAEASLL